MFKTMGYSPAFCSKSANFRPLRIHPKSTQTSAQALTNHFRTVLQAFQRVWSDFQDLPKSAMFKPWAIAQAFCSKSANFRPLRIHPKSTQTSAQALTNHFRTVLQAFQRVWSDFQDLPKSAMFKPWAIAQAFCSKSANFRHFRIHPKSTQTSAQALTNHFRTVLQAFQRVWSDFRDLPKSAMFKPWAIAQAFSQNRPIFDTSKSTLNRDKQSLKQSQIILERFCRRSREFGAISRTCQNRPCSKPWAIAQPFAQNRPIFDPYEFTLNRHKHPRKHSQIILERFCRRSREFGAISRTCQNRPCSNHGL